MRPMLKAEPLQLNKVGYPPDQSSATTLLSTTQNIKMSQEREQPSLRILRMSLHLYYFPIIAVQ